MKLNPPIAVCKLCFKEYQPITLLDIFDEHNCYCKKCISEISPVFIKFKVGRYKAIAIYEYSHKIQSLLYQFKGCFDVELFGIFIERFRRELKFRYCDYVLIPAPSFKKDDEERGFNHVVEMFKVLKLPFLDIVVKVGKIKQASLNAEKRSEINKYLKLKEKPNLKNKKVLIVDDVYTTGSTIKSMINLIEPLHPKTIEVLVMSKTTLN